MEPSPRKGRSCSASPPVLRAPRNSASLPRILHMAPISKPGQIAIIIPACDEEACLGQVLDELLAVIDREKFVVAVGVNGSSDKTAQIARARGVFVAESSKRGYGYGCQSAIDLLVGAVAQTW